VAVFVRHISRNTVIFINTITVKTKTGHRLYYTLVAFAAPGAAFAPLLILHRFESLAPRVLSPQRPLLLAERWLPRAAAAKGHT
jgi:hypothetical protein